MWSSVYDFESTIMVLRLWWNSTPESVDALEWGGGITKIRIFAPF